MACLEVCKSPTAATPLVQPFACVLPADVGLNNEPAKITRVNENFMVVRYICAGKTNRDTGLNIFVLLAMSLCKSDDQPAKELFALSCA